MTGSRFGAESGSSIGNRIRQFRGTAFPQSFLVTSHWKRRCHTKKATGRQRVARHKSASSERFRDQGIAQAGKQPARIGIITSQALGNGWAHPGWTARHFPDSRGSAPGQPGGAAGAACSQQGLGFFGLLPLHAICLGFECICLEQQGVTLRNYGNVRGSLSQKGCALSIGLGLVYPPVSVGHDNSRFKPGKWRLMPAVER